MANYAYLCISNHETIYPAFADKAYNSAESTIAICASNVPLLWFALFRPADLVTRTFHTDDGPYVVTAPITTRRQALAQLAAAVPRLERLFADRGSVEEYTDLLCAAIRSASGRYATIEWDEIDVITEGGFLAEATAAMASLDPQTALDAVADRTRLLRLSGIGRRDTPFPPALCRHRGQCSSEDEHLHSRLIGVSHLRPVPWEAPVA